MAHRLGWLWIVLLVSCDGATGLPGESGATGPTGATGPQGAAGEPGSTGQSVDAVALGIGDATCPNGGTLFQIGDLATYACSGAPAMNEESVGVFAGLTPGTYVGGTAPGTIGGRLGAHAICAAEYPGAHLCHYAEYVQSNSTLSLGAQAWLDPSTEDGTTAAQGNTTLSGRFVDGETCLDWTNGTAGQNGTTLHPSGGSPAAACNVAKPLACCTTPSRTRFAGFTTATVEGHLIGDRQTAHTRCATEFPGSHMCHAAEYIRTNAPTAPGATAAWMDASRVGADSSLSGSPRAGRDAVPSPVNNCSGWDGSSSASAALVGPQGQMTTASCGTPRQIACCF